VTVRLTGGGVGLGRGGPRLRRPAGAAATPTRFYLPTTAGRPVTVAPDASWEVATIGVSPLALGGKLVLAKSGTATGGPAVVKSSAANPCDVLCAQHVSDPLTAGATITGTLSFVARCAESVNTGDEFLQLVARVVSGDGATVRGTLYAGQTATAVTATATDPTGEMTTTASTRSLTVAVSSVAAQTGDRLVIETGARSCTAATGHTAFIRYGDPAATADHALGAGVTTDLVPWVELSATLAFT
jgi:hypothetical protein